MNHLTWHLWQNIRFPARLHPLFRRWHTRQIETSRRWMLAQILLIVGSGLLVLVEPLAFAVVLLLWAIVPVLALLLNGTALGAFWAAQISHKLATERLGQHYDLLQLTPRGALGSSWLMATAILHRQERLLSANRIVRTVAGFLLAICLVGTGLFILSLITMEATPITRQNQSAWLQSVLPFGALSLLIWLDHIQSSLLAVLIGLITPTFFSETFQAQLVAAFGYVSIQIGIAIALIIGVIGLQVLLNGVAQPILQTAALSIWVIVLLYLLRETAISFLLRVVLWRYHLQPNELWDSVS